jgi:hypothetical protein
LGWSLNTRLLLILLPDDKHEAWSTNIIAIVALTIGRLNHVGYIIPLARHFLNRLRLRLSKRRHKNQQLSLSRAGLDDLALWIDFLATAQAGISLNRITTRAPSKICWSDLRPFGIGGFLLSGHAWRIQIPSSSPIYGADIANNVLKFLGMMLTVWLVLLECDKQGSEEECILALGDNTFAIGWMYKSGQLLPGSPYYEPVQLIARKLARLITASSHCLASQHIKGDYNTVTDLLSYAGDVRRKAHPLANDYPCDTLLTERFHSCIPHGYLPTRALLFQQD